MIGVDPGSRFVGLCRLDGDHYLAADTIDAGRDLAALNDLEAMPQIDDLADRVVGWILRVGPSETVAVEWIATIHGHAHRGVIVSRSVAEAIVRRLRALGVDVILLARHQWVRRVRGGGPAAVKAAEVRATIGERVVGFPLSANTHETANAHEIDAAGVALGAQLPDPPTKEKPRVKRKRGGPRAPRTRTAPTAEIIANRAVRRAASVARGVERAEARRKATAAEQRAAAGCVCAARGRHKRPCPLAKPAAECKPHKPHVRRAQGETAEDRARAMADWLRGDRSTPLA